MTHVTNVTWRHGQGEAGSDWRASGERGEGASGETLVDTLCSIMMCDKEPLRDISRAGLKADHWAVGLRWQICFHHMNSCFTPEEFRDQCWCDSHVINYGGPGGQNAVLLCDLLPVVSWLWLCFDLCSQVWPWLPAKITSQLIGAMGKQEDVLVQRPWTSCRTCWDGR